MFIVQATGIRKMYTFLSSCKKLNCTKKKLYTNTSTFTFNALVVSYNLVYEKLEQKSSNQYKFLVPQKQWIYSQMIQIKQLDENLH